MRYKIYCILWQKKVLFTGIFSFSTTFIFHFTACSKLFTSETGTLTSPGFPSRCPYYTLCTYAIRLEKGAKVQLIFQNISLVESNSWNYLKIYDGRNSSAPLLAQLQSDVLRKILASGNEVFIEYKVHWYDTRKRQWRGFRLRYFDNQGKK